MTVYNGTITNFTTTPQQGVDIGGAGYNVQTAGQSYSLEQVDSQTLRFELQGGDHAWFDGSGVDRSEVSGGTHFPVGTPININYSVMLPTTDPTNSASWMLIGELHNDDSQLPNGWSSSPPLYLGLTGDHLTVIARYAPSGVNPNDSAGNNTMLTLWTDPNPMT